MEVALLQLNSFSNSNWELKEILESCNSSFGGGLGLYIYINIYY